MLAASQAIYQAGKVFGKVSLALDIRQTHEATAARRLQLEKKQSAIGELLAEADSNFAEDPTFAIHIFCDFWMSLVFRGAIVWVA